MNGQQSYNYLSFCCKCTREEYINFCAQTAVRPKWTTVLGAVCFVGGSLLALLDDERLWAIKLFLILVGAVLMLFGSLFYPLFIKGEAGRRFDDKKSTLGNAVTVVIRDSVLSFSAADREGEIPLDALTEVVNSEQTKMMKLAFGDEVTLLVPWRALNDDEYGTLLSILKPYMKS